ncbi:hypothetical protein PIB30_061565 [Stylosanthes scabra]|uniref:Uncharacterized protein n=1 Tax=Stylosanthes scabra TaxID=79078 RepID=A0ABU6WJ68_9FABA|nr:hypothetical protein [Stylosanthes scabra]
MALEEEECLRIIARRRNVGGKVVGCWRHSGGREVCNTKAGGQGLDTSVQRLERGAKHGGTKDRRRQLSWMRREKVRLKARDGALWLDLVRDGGSGGGSGREWGVRR